MDLAVRTELLPSAPRPAPAVGVEPVDEVSLSCSVLAEIAAGLARAEPLWRAVVRHHPAGRQPVRLLATEAYEAWVIGWSPGQGVDLHDHGQSAGALVVVEGELTELVPRAGRLASRPLEVGPVWELPVGVIHDVVNRGTAAATSVHVYSPPLSVMSRYDPITLAPLGSEPVEPEAPVLPPGAAPAVLHPANRWQPVPDAQAR